MMWQIWEKCKVKRLLFNILCLYINYYTIIYMCEHLGLFGNKPDNNALIILALYVQYKYQYGYFWKIWHALSKALCALENYWAKDYGNVGLNVAL